MQPPQSESFLVEVEHDMFFFTSNGNSEKIRAPDGIRTHEPTTLRNLVRCVNHWATGELNGEQGWNVGLWLELHHAVSAVAYYILPDLAPY